MKNWGKICRICTSPAEYDIFAKIPTYLHATTNEFLIWQKPINQMIEDVTGLKISTNDNLPRYICATCISYLKHAASFREQVFNNTLSLTLAFKCGANEPNQQTEVNEPLVSTDANKDDLLITAEDLNYLEHRPGEQFLLNNSKQLEQQQNKVHKQLLNDSLVPGSYEQQMRYLNRLFDKEPNAGLRSKPRNCTALHIPNTAVAVGSAGSNGSGTGEEEYPTATTSSDDNEEMPKTLDKNFYNYREKNFEEDDIMNTASLQKSITINIPELFNERKCRACCRRYMFENSFTEHLDNCPEHYFLNFIDELNKLLSIRKSKAISPHEYIRRVIFSIRKACEWLKRTHNDEAILNLLQTGTNDTNTTAETNISRDSSGFNVNNDIHMKAAVPTTIEKSTIETVASAAFERETEKLNDKNLPLNSMKSCTGSQTLRSRTARPQQQQDFPYSATWNLGTDKQEGNTYLTSDQLLEKLRDQQAKTWQQRKTETKYNINTKNAQFSVIPNDEETLIGQWKWEEVPVKCRTPITPQSNILYEIEKAENSNSSTKLQKPIPIRCTQISTAGATAAETPSAAISNQVWPLCATKQKSDFVQTPRTRCFKAGILDDNEAEKAFIRKLQNAQQDNIIASTTATAATSNLNNILKFTARCNPCKLLFDAVSDFEMHNATQHNKIELTSQTVEKTKEEDQNEQRKRIIALFEDNN